MSQHNQNGTSQAKNSQLEDPKSLSILYKRRGHFDTKRDELLETFTKSEAHDELLVKVQEIVNTIVHKNPELLLKNRGQLAALIEGTISRTGNDSTASTGKAIPSLGKHTTPNIQLEQDAGDNLYDIFDEHVKQSTIGSKELKDSIREELQRLRGD